MSVDAVEPDSPSDESPLFLTISEVAQILGISTMTVRRRVQAGAWPSGRCGGQHLILREFVDDVIAEVRAGRHPDFDVFAAQWLAKANKGAA
ncbi:helix-turn-helix domain-containing protein [Actinomadura rubrisoli]|uniref:helix-turn-helix domain-containing protein n=1 Tax=Actinomadura rubrisoli TaxID=2530368 RepID=UPI001404455C|nr:helix-turn-helix domain-containing protein [Actinomadura rubrisoli]